MNNKLCKEADTQTNGQRNLKSTSFHQFFFKRNNNKRRMESGNNDKRKGTKVRPRFDHVVNVGKYV